MMNSFTFCLKNSLSPLQFWRILPVVPLRRGHYFSKGVVEQILVGVFRKQPSYVTTHLSDGEVQPVAFRYCARTSTLSLVEFSLNTGVDGEVCITVQHTWPWAQRAPCSFQLLPWCFLVFWDLYCTLNFPDSKSFLYHQCTNKQQISHFLAFTF